MYSHSIWKVKPSQEPARVWNSVANKMAPFPSQYAFTAFLETDAKFAKGQLITWHTGPSLVNSQHACVLCVLDVAKDLELLMYDSYTGAPKYLYMQAIYTSAAVCGNKKWDDDRSYRALEPEEMEWVMSNDLIQNRIKEAAPDFVISRSLAA